MNGKRILIVDDEESILVVLKNSLKKLGPDYQIATVTDGFAALDQIMAESFDLIVTDYNMAHMDGLELLEAIHYTQPNAQVIMMTAYGNDILEAEARRLQIRYLAKPLEINLFRQVVQETLDDLPAGQFGILILSHKRHQQISQLLEQLRSDVSARCLFLADVQGHIIARLGNADQISMEETASLLGGSIATLREAGHAIDGDPDAINLAYREGKHEYLYALNIGQRLLLVLIIDRGQYTSRLGTVWYYAQQVVVTLRQILRETEYANPRQIFDARVDQAFQSELDKLFGNDNAF